jgi:hypothetical protein
MVVRARPFANLRYSLHISVSFVTVYDELPQCMLGLKDATSLSFFVHNLMLKFSVL